MSDRSEATNGDQQQQQERQRQEQLESRVDVLQEQVQRLDAGILGTSSAGACEDGVGEKEMAAMETRMAR